MSSYKLVFEIAIPNNTNAIASEALQQFVNERIERLRNEMQHYVRSCNEDIKHFVNDNAKMETISLYCCTWVENDWDRNESTTHMRYFSRQYQAETCRDQNRGACVNVVSVWKDLRDFSYYKSLNPREKIYVELSQEDKQREQQQKKLAYLEQEMQRTREGHSW